MKKFPYEISIPANTEAEADIKMEAIQVLASYLTAKELEKLAYIVKEEPVKMSMAKTYLGV